MKKFIILSISLFLLIFPVSINAKEQVSFYLFYGDGCPHCASEKSWLNEIKNDYKNVDFNYLEIWYDEDNQELYEKVKEAYEINQSGVPLTIIGNKYFIGFNDYTKEQIKDLLNKCSKESCIDYVSKIKNNEEVVVEKPEQIIPDEKVKAEVESKKALGGDYIIIFGIVVVLALLFGIVGVDFMKRRKKA